MTVQPFPSRYTATDQGDRLVITLPARRDWIVIVFLGFWSLVWLGVEVTVLSTVAASLLRGGLGIGWGEWVGIAPFALVWLSIWTFGGLFAVYTWLWQVTGREVIEVNREGIRLSRRVLGRGGSKLYLVEHIQDLRVSPFPFPFGNRMRFGRSGSPWSVLGTLAFDYGARTIRFADADEAEGKMILKEIVRRYGRYEAK